MEPLGIITRGYQRAAGAFLELLVITRGYLSVWVAPPVYAVDGTVDMPADAATTIAMESLDAGTVAMEEASGDEIDMMPETG